MPFEHIAVIGAGAWGSALANMLARAGRDVRLIARDQASADVIANTRASPRLPGVILDNRIGLAPAGAADASFDAVLVAVPSQELRAALTVGARTFAPAIPVIACAKGIECSTRKFMTDIISECAPQAHAGILSGPSFAHDVARGLPTAVTLAMASDSMAAELARALGSPTFRPYHTGDVRGVEIGGAAKNVLAIGAGIVAGRGLGASAAAALITRGFSELFRFGKAFGARPETLTGLSGLGDLILTCSSPQSRNYSLGLAIGQGHAAREAQAKASLAEGAFTAPVLVAMAQEKGIDMPIAGAVAAILDERASVDEAIETLLTRPFRAEG
jgi:glycerol-3-phosphate dehydrogenase (NAD(P)+)